jgi:hypothetical protein
MVLKVAAGVFLGLALFVIAAFGLLTLAETQRQDALRAVVTQNAQRSDATRGIRQAEATREALQAVATRTAFERCRAAGGFTIEQPGGVRCIPLTTTPSPP